MTQINHYSKFITIGKVMLFCAIITALLKFSLFITSLIPGLPKNFLSSAIGPILTLLVTYLFLKLDKKSFSDIGLKFEPGTIKKFCFGLLAGVVIMNVFLFSIVYSSGFEIRLSGNTNILFLLLAALPTIILLAFMEEIIFRAYSLVILKNEFGTVAALAITSILFGLYHIVFGWGIAGFFSTGIWGFVFGSLAIYSNGISMPTGFHSGGNLAQLALGLTGGSYGIWNIVSKNGQPITDFSKSQTSIIVAEFIILILTIVFINRVIKAKTSGNA